MLVSVVLKQLISHPQTKVFSSSSLILYPGTVDKIVPKPEVKKHKSQIYSEINSLESVVSKEPYTQHTN